MHCPKCGSQESAKAGFIAKKQRYQCKHCPCKYTQNTPRGKSEAIKKVALKLCLSGVSMRRIGQILSVSTVAILKWIRQACAEKVALPAGKATVIEIVELDELCTFLAQKNARFGYGLLFVERQGESLTGKWVVEEVAH